MIDSSNSPERPRTEPEILPPDPARRRAAAGRDDWRTSEFADFSGAHRIYVTRLGPFGGFVLMLGVALLVVVILLALVGALLIWLPLVVLGVVIAVLSGLLRWRR